MSRFNSTVRERHATPVLPQTAKSPLNGRHSLQATFFSGLLLFILLCLMAGLAKAQSLAAPSSLSAATISKYQVNLQWNDPNPASSGNQETGYVIERAKGSPTVWSEASVTPADTTAWPNMSLAAGTTYFFRVRAFVVSGGATTYSAYSPVASARYNR